MTRQLITIAPGASIPRKPAGCCAEHRLRRLPVVENDQLVGIIARPDLVRAVAESADRASPAPVRDVSVYDARLAELELADLAQPRTGGKAVLTILVSFLRCGVRCIGTTRSMIRSMP